MGSVLYVRASFMASNTITTKFYLAAVVLSSDNSRKSHERSRVLAIPILRQHITQCLIAGGLVKYCQQRDSSQWGWAIFVVSLYVRVLAAHIKRP